MCNLSVGDQHLLDGTDNFCHRLAAVSIKPLVHTILHLLGYGRIDEVGSTDFDGCSTTHHKLDGILGILDTAQSYYRNLHGVGHIVNHA